MNTINFLNRFSEPITMIQAMQMQEYIKETFVNDKIKFREKIKDNKVCYLEYFLSSTENINQIIELYPNIGIQFYKDEVISGIYHKYNIECFNENGLLVSKFIEVYGNGIYPIYFKPIDAQTNETIKIEKSYYFYDTDIEYEFHYDKITGDFIELCIYDPHNVVDTDMHDFNNNNMSNNPFGFTWVGFEYYQNAEPIIPQGGIPV